MQLMIVIDRHHYSTSGDGGEESIDVKIEALLGVDVSKRKFGHTWAILDLTGDYTADFQAERIRQGLPGVEVVILSRETRPVKIQPFDPRKS